MRFFLTRLLPLLVLATCGAIVAQFLLREPPAEPKDPDRVSQVVPPVVPRLLPARATSLDDPPASWERLLVEDGSPAEDRAALADIVTSYLQGTLGGGRAPLGPNEEFVRALTDVEVLGDSAIPADHPAILDGELVDRWGSPWFFHQEAADVIDVRSAGPDRKLFTADDVVK